VGLFRERKRVKMLRALLQNWKTPLVVLIPALFLGLNSRPTYGGTWSLLDLREFSFEGYHLADHRDENLTFDGSDKEPWRGGLATNFDLDLLKYRDYGLVWLNRVHGAGSYKQMREVGWQYRVGLELGPKLMLFWDHHSRHLLDTGNDYGFPLDNSFGAKITFFKRDGK
jgi:hypothetical protein